MARSLTKFRAAIGYPQEDNNNSERFAFSGGLSLEEVTAIGDPAKLLFCKNYEPNYSGGYRSKGGCEPVDGHRQPSAFVYQLIPVTIIDATKTPSAVGQQINNQVDALTDIGPFFLGWENLNGIRYIVLTNTIKNLITSSYDFNLVSGNDWRETFLDVGTIATGTTLYTGTHSSPNNFATTLGPPTFLGDISKAIYYISLARKVARSFILPVGGSACTGGALGAFDLNGFLFAFRALTGGNAGMFAAGGPGDGGTGIAPGWNLLTQGSIVYFTANNAPALAEGATVTTLAGASMIVHRLITMFGTVGGGDAIGYFSVRSITGTTPANGVALQVSGNTVAMTPASGTVVRAVTFPATGNYRFKRWNFTGVANSVRGYMVTGSSTAFEIDAPSTTSPFATIATPIITGQGLTVATFNANPTADTPQRIETWQDQLFLFYRGGNYSHSGFQDPTNWTAVEGADQRYLGEDVTNAIGNINGAMIITTRNRMRVLYGDVNENFQLRDLNTEAGAFAATAIPIGGLCMLTDEGVNFYDQTAQFGNFSGISLSQGINSLLKSYMSSGNGPLEACIQRDHSFYRLFFDGGIFFTFCIVGNELRGIGNGAYELGSVVVMTTAGISVSGLKVGDTVLNADETASFIVRRGTAATISGNTVTTLYTDARINVDDWVVGSDIMWQGVAIGTVTTASINSARNFWSAATTITNGNYNLTPGEKIYFCSDDGYVYEDDVGGAFGILGTPIRFAFQNQFYYGQQSIDHMKYYRRIDMDVIGADALSNISFSAEYDDGNGYRAVEKPELVTRSLTASGFDQSAVYGIGFYGGAGKNVIRKMLHGTGVGISILVSGESDIAFPHTIQAGKLSYATRSRQGWR